MITGCLEDGVAAFRVEAEAEFGFVQGAVAVGIRVVGGGAGIVERTEVSQTPRLDGGERGGTGFDWSSRFPHRHW